MIGWLVSLGLSERAARIAVPVGIAIAALLAFYALLDAYGDARADQREVEVDAAWKAAAVKLERQSSASAAAADKPADAREVAYADKLATEKEKIDATIDHGGDPLDVLF